MHAASEPSPKKILPKQSRPDSLNKATSVGVVDSVKRSKKMPTASRLFAILLVLPLALSSGILSAADAAEEQSKSDTPAEAKKSKFDQLTSEVEKYEGLWTLYHSDQKLLADIPSKQLGKNFIVVTSIARGISSGMVLGGMSWGFGDELIWGFRKVGDNIHVLRRNVRFRAKPGTAEAESVKLAYSDSVLYALPILTKTSGGYLVDLTRIFMSDDLEIGRNIGPGFRLAGDRTTWAKVKSFPKNVELQVAAVYSGSHGPETVSDPRGVQVYVHYSISELPENGYKPRVADDRVGYFLTVQKDFSENDYEEHFVRYITRWNLQKADPSADLSPPKEPIIFYLEKTIPINLRPYVRAGIEEWNVAFRKLGFDNAIEVRQQRDDDDWDPEDVRYNTFRWISAEAGFAMGPSRINPLTGQILDADIIFDASFLRHWTTEYETFTADDVARLIPNRGDGGLLSSAANYATHAHTGINGGGCLFCRGMQRQMGFAGAVHMVRSAEANGDGLPTELIHQGLKEVVMHEVGHTLGLRHNFKASAWKSLKSIDEIGSPDQPTVASVMDYSPANIAAPGEKQGLYFSQTIGPYDIWAIEYGYKEISGNEQEELKKIAARGAESGLDYATDEDMFGGLDPLTDVFDLGEDPLVFAQRRREIASELLPKVVERSVKDGEGYQRARQTFGMLFGEYWHAAGIATRFPGGVSLHRDHKGDPDGRKPFVIVDPERQREAMQLIAKYAFSVPAIDGSLLNELASTRWWHWGLRMSARADYPIHDIVNRLHDRMLLTMLSGRRLEVILDNEFKTPEGAKPYTLAEHMDLLLSSVFSEWLQKPKAQEYTVEKPYIDSFRRNLQRSAVKRLASLVTYGGGPEDARTLARMHLINLDKRARVLLKDKDLKLDDYSRAHLVDSQRRIQQVLNAELAVPVVQ